jgi:predicted ribosomally synthesized peptide with nif11-like leader
MAVSDAQAFVNQFFSDEDLRDKVMAVDTPQAKYQVIQDAGFSFSKEEALELLPEGVSLEDLQNLDPTSEELPDEILEAVSGGKSGTEPLDAMATAAQATAIAARVTAAAAAVAAV